ncbi:DUF4867 family protein [Saccharibacillus sp. CPCC 101409]|uniref:DUF4867 family protein n=1 Tax=Saccharibacillus sp. CPCC 101409 TaxID=3058041 RepID=UPI0026726F7C|nr:DUF4867 family protein [Saccharibacillus sp. CPCC 101409]MDO3411537.1 DUF4867 family protein [Saccharibacillus sp. CPCC 101409]
MNLTELNELNRSMNIRDVRDASFGAYGQIWPRFDVSEMIEFAERGIEVPDAGNRYVPSVAELEALDAAAKIEADVYGGLPVEIGYCAGRNARLTGLEYHQGSEVVIAVTDCIHIVGRRQDIDTAEQTYDAGLTEVFFQPKGTVVELYSTTLHYAPCRTSDEGYVTLVVLPKGTNSPLSADMRISNRLLTKKNKFLLAHGSEKAKIEAGVHHGLMGPLLEIRI